MWDATRSKFSCIQDIIPFVQFYRFLKMDNSCKKLEQLDVFFIFLSQLCQNKIALFTSNLRSPTGGEAYGIPRNILALWPSVVCIGKPRTSPYFVVTTNSSADIRQQESNNKQEIHRFCILK